MTKEKSYIRPFTKIYSTFDEAEKDFNEDVVGGHYLLFEKNEALEIDDLVKGTRNLIVGEPGIGKSELVKKIQEYHQKEGYLAVIVKLKISDPKKEINDFLHTVEPDDKKVLLLDALDETNAEKLSEVLETIEEISKNRPQIRIYVSSRWIFINKYKNYFNGYRFIRIFPFTTYQVKTYLIQSLEQSVDGVDDLVNRVMQFNHSKQVIQIPRYLFLLKDYLENLIKQKKDINVIEAISRNELFEYFITSKLKLEDENEANSHPTALSLRVLEKLALVMEIYQTNSITKDELLTFFDDIDSDIKLAVLTRSSLNRFIDKTLLLDKGNDIDKVEFDNTEFQEYLAAKEIQRFIDPIRATFNFAKCPDVPELYSTWFNTLTFLVDDMPSVLEPLLDFSGISRDEYRIIDEGFFNFLAKISTNRLSNELKKRIFIDVLNYYERTLQWLPGKLASSLRGYITPGFDAELKNRIKLAERKKDPKRYIILGNLVDVAAYLLDANLLPDWPYWRKKFIKYSKDKNNSGVLQRHALLGLEMGKDSSVIDELPLMSEIQDELIESALLSTCNGLSPDHPKSLEYAMKAVMSNKFGGAYYIYKIEKTTSIITFLNEYIGNDVFRKEFLEDTVRYTSFEATKLISNIDKIFNPEIQDLCEKALLVSVRNYLSSDNLKSDFLLGIFNLLKKRKEGFLLHFLGKFFDEPRSTYGLWTVQGWFVENLSIEDIPSFIKIMKENGENHYAMRVLADIRSSEREGKEEIYESGRTMMLAEYTDWEKPQLINIKRNDTHSQDIVKTFRSMLNTEPGYYFPGMFQYYNSNQNELAPFLTEEDKEKFIQAIKRHALGINPIGSGLTISQEPNSGLSRQYTSSQTSQIFGDALLAAKSIGMDIDEYKVNIASYIPFAYDHELEVIFDLVKNFTPDEMKPVEEIYKKKLTDLWRFNPSSFVGVIRRYNLVNTFPILKTFVKEKEFNRYVREEALQLADLFSPDVSFLEEVFSLFINSDNLEDKAIALLANSLLITTHANGAAIKWRVEEIKKKEILYKRNDNRSGSRMHSIDDNEDELRHGKPFAKPLMELKTKGFEDIYLSLLDTAMEVWNKGDDFHAYSQYIWSIVYEYFNNLTVYKKHTPLILLEDKIRSLKKKEGANWLAGKMLSLRQAYLRKPDSITESVRKYNEAKKYNSSNILNSEDLFEVLKDAIEIDLRDWIEGEGAYDIICSQKEYSKQNNQYETLVQKTIKPQMLHILDKRGCQGIDIAREEQLIDEKRTDLIIRYGFIGPIILEIKLTSNSDIDRVEKSKSYTSMKRYMKGYGAAYGIFLIIINSESKKIEDIKKAFNLIKNVWSTSLDSYTLSKAKETSKTNLKVKKKAPSKVNAIKKKTTKKNKIK